MPIQIDRAAARRLAPRLAEALELVHNEFDGLDTHRQYRNAFSRLLKPDPLGRVAMLGTDQRDLFVPVLRRAISECVPRDGHIFDFGAGDGQTFALVADAVPAGTRVSLEEPNPGYLADYVAFLESQPNLRVGVTLAAGFDALDSMAACAGVALPPDRSIDLCLALHMIYFVGDLAGGLLRMVRWLKPGGGLVVVATDETDNYTGRAFEKYAAGRGDEDEAARRAATLAERRRLLGTPEERGGAILELLRAAGITAEFTAQRQPSRLYGHSLADVIALSSIAALADVEGLDKFDAAASLLQDEPERVDLRIEDTGPRTGMWSVKQPQWVSVVRRVD